MKHVNEDRCILSTDDIKFYAWCILWTITRFYAERMCHGEPWHTPKELLELNKEEIDTFYELVNIVCDKEINLEKLKGNVKLKHIGYFEILLQKLETKSSMKSLVEQYLLEQKLTGMVLMYSYNLGGPVCFIRLDPHKTSDDSLEYINLDQIKYIETLLSSKKCTIYHTDNNITLRFDL